MATPSFLLDTAPVVGADDMYGTDQRSGHVDCADGAGTHHFQIFDPSGSANPPQDLYYAFCPTGANPRTALKYVALNVPKKIYSVDFATIFDGQIVLQVQVNTSVAPNPTKVAVYFGTMQGITVTPFPPTGGGSGSGTGDTLTITGDQIDKVVVTGTNLSAARS